MGVRGSEDVGGLTGWFQLETSFRVDSNFGTFADRNSAAGLRGRWGTALMGRWDMPFRAATIQIDPYFDLTPSGIAGVLNDQGGNFNQRASNIVQYWSPNMGGFAFRVATRANEERASGMDPRIRGASVTYTRGALHAFAAWELRQNRAIADRKEQALAVGGTYAFGALKVGGQYQQLEKSGRSDTKGWMANAIYTVGSNQFIAQYMRSKGGASPGNVDPACNSWSLGYQYNFSSRTFFLASYVRVENNDAGTCNLGTNPIAIDSGQDPRALFAGICHFF
jgi:predicted porin